MLLADSVVKCDSPDPLLGICSRLSACETWPPLSWVAAAVLAQLCRRRFVCPPLFFIFFTPPPPRLQPAPAFRFTKSQSRIVLTGLLERRSLRETRKFPGKEARGSRLLLLFSSCVQERCLRVRAAAVS